MQPIDTVSSETLAASTIPKYQDGPAAQVMSSVMPTVQQTPDVAPVAPSGMMPPQQQQQQVQQPEPRPVQQEATREDKYNSQLQADAGQLLDTLQQQLTLRPEDAAAYYQHLKDQSSQMQAVDQQEQLEQQQQMQAQLMQQQMMQRMMLQEQFAHMQQQPNFT